MVPVLVVHPSWVIGPPHQFFLGLEVHGRQTHQLQKDIRRGCRSSLGPDLFKNRPTKTNHAPMMPIHHVNAQLQFRPPFQRFKQWILPYACSIIGEMRWDLTYGALSVPHGWRNVDPESM